MISSRLDRDIPASSLNARRAAATHWSTVSNTPSLPTGSDVTGNTGSGAPADDPYDEPADGAGEVPLPSRPASSRAICSTC